MLFPMLDFPNWDGTWSNHKFEKSRISQMSKKNLLRILLLLTLSGALGSARLAVAEGGPKPDCNPAAGVPCFAGQSLR
jgi:hypothetical protein